MDRIDKKYVIGMLVHLVVAATLVWAVYRDGYLEGYMQGVEAGQPTHAH